MCVQYNTKINYTTVQFIQLVLQYYITVFNTYTRISKQEKVFKPGKKLHKNVTFSFSANSIVIKLKSLITTFCYKYRIIIIKNKSYVKCIQVILYKLIIIINNIIVNNCLINTFYSYHKHVHCLSTYISTLFYA